MADKIIDKQIAFAIEYVKDFNGTRAAERAGYGGSDPTLGAIASQNLKILKVRHKIAELLEANAMSAEEALWRLAEMARVDISIFIKGKNGDFSINWSNVKKYGFLIKSITMTKYGPRLTLHDSQKALELIGKHLALFTDKTEITGDGQFNINVNYGDRPSGKS